MKQTKLQTLLEITTILIVVLSIVYLFVNWNTIPDKVPIHWGVHGQANSWAGKKSLLWEPILNVITTTILLLFFHKRNLIHTYVEGSNKGKEETYVGNMILVIAVPMALLFFYIEYISANLKSSISSYMLIILIGIMILAIIYYAVRIYKLQKEDTRDNYEYKSKENGEINRSDPKYWKMGVFYYNHNDKKLFVPKRIGLGWTINFAHFILCILFLLVIILIPTLIIYLSMH